MPLLESTQIAPTLANITLLDWPTWQIAAALGALSLGLFVQGAVGFGSGLFAIPLMLWCEIELPTSIAICYVGTVVQTVWNSYQNRQDIPWNAMPLISVTRLLTLPIGVALLAYLTSAGQSTVKLTVGLLMLAIVISQNTFKPQPREHVGRGWTLLAGSASGIIGGMIGMGAPPIVFWMMAHDWPTARCRAFMWVQLVLLIPPALGLLMYEFFEPAVDGIVIGLIGIPIAIGAAYVGGYLGGKLSLPRLRMVVYVLLYIVAISSIIGALV